MSDDFFEDDVVEEKAAPAKKPAPKSKGSVKAAAAAKAAKGGAGDGIGSFNLGIKVDLTWVVVIAIVALALGWTGHAAFFGKSSGDSSSVQYSSGQNGSAPVLSDDTIKKYQSGEVKLPAGHPSLGATGTASGQAAPSGSGAPAGGSTGSSTGK